MTLKKHRAENLIIGAGIYGLYLAYRLSVLGKEVIVLEMENEGFLRASYVNQARIHNGYHYPRSLSTALNCKDYYQRFRRDFDFAINGKFEKIYAISRKNSLTTAENFKYFCKNASIPCTEIYNDQHFKHCEIEASFLTEELSFDAASIYNFFIEKLKDFPNTKMLFNTKIDNVEIVNDEYRLTNAELELKTSRVYNCTYASINQVSELFDVDSIALKYELTEMVLVDTNLKAGLTVMDGLFFSIMPFGFDKYSLSSVHYTPHLSCNEKLPKFSCQARNSSCSIKQLQNCNPCPAKPDTNFEYMKKLAYKYLNDDIKIEFRESIFTIKTILTSTEITDGRPTIFRKVASRPDFIQVLGGKINNIYDLDGEIDE